MNGIYVCVVKSLLLTLLLSFSLSASSQSVTISATLGTPTGSYSTLKGAFDAINAGTHQGVIVISMNASTSETSSAVLNASGSGSASYTSINIYPTTTGVSISGNLGAPLIDLNGADNVTIDGRVNATGSTKSLLITNTSTSNVAGTSTIRFMADACSNAVKYCTLKGSSTDAAAGIVFFSTATTSGNDNNSITNNDITAAADANRPLNAVFARGTDTKNNDNNVISHNNIYDFISRTTSSQGVSISSYNSGYTISGNSFYETTDLLVTGDVVYNIIQISAAQGAGSGFTISGNYIGGREAMCNGTAWTKVKDYSVTFTAISVSTASGTASEIQGNTITNINWTNTLSVWFNAISISGATAANIGTSMANTIGASSGTGSITFTAGTTGSIFHGMRLNSTGTVDCRNNVIGAITTANNQSGAAPTFYGILNISSGNCMIISNMIGSSTTPYSIHASTKSLGTNQVVHGINSQGVGTAIISENIITNLVNGSESTTGGTTTGIFVGGSIGSHTVTGNIVCNLSINNAVPTVDGGASVFGIVLNSTTTAVEHTISANTVYNLSNSNPSFAGAITGIRYNGPSTAGSVSRNFVHSFFVSEAASATSSFYGIKIDAGTATFSNNIINFGGNTSTNLYGIFQNGLGTNSGYLFNNTVHLWGSLASGASNKSYALYSTGTTSLRDFRNNILVNARSTPGGSGLHYALYIANSDGTINCKNNNYHVSGTGGVLGYFGADKTTTPIITGQVTGNDANSITTDPSFFAIGTKALGFAPSVPGLGDGTAGINIDYSGNTRNATSPTMGAFEVVSWTGSSSSDWNTASNWSSGVVPLASTLLNIPAGSSNYPALSGALTSSSLSLASGASLNLNGQTLILNLDLKNNGSITGTGSVKMAGTAAQTISGRGTISNLEINNAAGVTITSGVGNMQTITSRLTPTSGTLTTNGNLTLRSDINGTVRVLQGSASGGYISGDVITQRYLALHNSGRTGRAWRLVTIPVSGSGTLSDIFMAGQSGADLTESAKRSAQPAGIGTVVIGHNQPDAVTANGLGYDWIGVAGQVSSLRYFQQNAGGGTFASTQVPALNTPYSVADQGYMLFARGDRQQTYNATSNASATTLQATGPLKQGTISVAIPALASAGYVLVGNPYMSVLDMEQVYSDADNAGVIENTVYIWDASIDGNSFKQGGYRAVVRTDPGTWTITGTSMSNPQYIESGSAFFVKPTASGGTLRIKEVHKVDGTPGISPHGSTANVPSRLFINLEVADTANRRLVDGAVVFFDAKYKYEWGDPVDIAPMTNISSGSITLRQSDKRLSMEGRPWPADSTARTIPVDMRNLGDDAYVLSILQTNMKREGFTALLKDRHLNHETVLNIDGETLYPFRRTGDLNIDSSRFEISYRLSKPTNIGTLTPDDVAVEIAPRLYPNPARAEDVKLSLGSLAPGRYDVQVLDMSGRLVLTTFIDHTSSNTAHQILRGQKIKAGQYLLRISDNDRLLQTLQLIQE